MVGLMFLDLLDFHKDFVRSQIFVIADGGADLLPLLHHSLLEVGLLVVLLEPAINVIFLGLWELHVGLVIAEAVIVDSFGYDAWGSVLVIVVHFVVLTSKEVVNCLLELTELGILTTNEEVGMGNDRQAVSSMSGSWGFFSDGTHAG